MRKFSEKVLFEVLACFGHAGRQDSGDRQDHRRRGRPRSREKVVLYFRNMSRGLILNQTNGARLAGSLGDDMDSWVGHTVTRTTEWTSFRGEGFRNFVSPTPTNPSPPNNFRTIMALPVPGSGQYLSPDA